MDINKAIRKQEKSNRRFLLILGFIFLALPVVLLITNKSNLFLILYLGVIEILTMTTILISINSSYLKYSSDGYKLRVRFSPLTEEFILLCEKVVMIHAEGQGSHMEIVILSSSRLRNKKVREIDENLLRKYPVAANHYYRIKKSSPENSYYYIIVSKGGYHKYKILDLLYRTCVHAQFTDDTVERIKEYRSSQN